MQLEHLKRLPVVAKALAAETIEAHGWVFEVEYGRVLTYDLPSGRFVPLLEAYSNELV